MREYLFIVVVAAVITYAATPLMRRLAVRLGAFTAVRDRDVHATPIPRMGGVAIFVGFAAAMLVASRLPFLKACWWVRAWSAWSGRSTTSASSTG